jgi:hypothetical protein
MARYAGGGKPVESCRSINVLEWHRRGYPNAAVAYRRGS